MKSRVVTASLLPTTKSRVVTAVTALATALSVLGCSASVLTSRATPEERNRTGLEELDEDWEPEEGDDHASEGDVALPDEQSTPESASVAFDGSEDPNKRPARKQEVAVTGSAWRSASRRTVIDDVRADLKRRCRAAKRACAPMKLNDKCAGGDPSSCSRLGNRFATGKGVAESDEHAAAFWLKACKMNVRSCYGHGVRVFEGRSVQADHELAEQFFKSACERDFGLCGRIGDYYKRKKRGALALEYFHAGCNGGHARECTKAGR